MANRPPPRGLSKAGAGRPRSGWTQRAGTGPRASAKDAAQRAARHRDGDAPDILPWGGEGAEARRASPARKPRAAPRAAPPPSAATPMPAASRKAAISAAASAAALSSSSVQILSVEPDDAGMRLDRFIATRFPDVALTHVQRVIRRGEVRVSGHRAKPSDRLEAGWGIRVPPFRAAEPRPEAVASETDARFIRDILLYEDEDIMVLNKPFGLAVQGGSGTVRHVDGLLESMRDAKGQKPRLVHRLDKDTAGCLVVAKTRLAAATLAKSFRSRATRKIYWALVAGVPRVRQGRISTYLAKDEAPDGDARMEVAEHGQEGASHALTYYAVVDQAAQKLAWLSLKPVTGRTHQLRAHAAHIGHPIVGDPKYFAVENWELPGGIQNRLHLLARRIVVPHPRTGKPVDVTAPLPPHIGQSFSLLGFDTARYDPIEDAPER